MRRGDLLDDEARRTVLRRAGRRRRHVGPPLRPVVEADPGPASRTLLDLTDAVLEGEGGFHPADYPDHWRDGDLVLPLSYRYDPGGPLDGVSVHVPLTALNQFSGEGLDWQIPGHRAELVSALVRTLPKDIRRGLIPAAETTRAALERLGPPPGRLVDALSVALSDVSAARGCRRARSRRGPYRPTSDERDRRRRRRGRARRRRRPRRHPGPPGAGGPGGDRRPGADRRAAGDRHVGRRHRAPGRRDVAAGPRRAGLPGVARRRRQRVAAGADEPGPPASG